MEGKKTSCLGAYRHYFMNNKVYIFCRWDKNIDEQFIPIVNFFKKKYRKIICVTLSSSVYNEGANKSKAFDKIVILDNIYSLRSFIVSHKKNKNMFFFYNHKDLNNIELKIHLSIKLSFVDVIYLPRTVYLLQQKNINLDLYAPQIKNIFYKILIRKFIINIKIIMTYAFFCPFFIIKQKIRNRSDKKTINDILFIRLDRFGDMVLTFSSLVALRDAYPNAKISVLCSNQGMKLLKLQNKLTESRLLDDIFIWEDVWDMHGQKVPGIRHLVNMLKFIIKLRKKKFDLIIQPMPISIWTILSLLLKANKNIGAINKNLLLSRLIEKHVDYPIVIEKNEYIHCFKQNANCLHPLGINKVKKAEIGYDISGINKKIKEISTKNNLVINISAGDIARKLTQDKLISLIDKIIDHFKKYQIILIGTKEDVNFSENIFKTAPDKIVKVVGETDINDLIYIFKHSDILITPDTGTMHLASLTNIYIIAYFGAGNLKNFAPITDRCSIIKHELGCSGCGDICFTDTIPKPCIEAISVNELFNEVKKVLDNKAN